MRLLVLGGTGQVGWELQRALLPLGEVIAPGAEIADLARGDSLRAAVEAADPHVIVNAAAYNAVDRAESEPERAMAINGTAPGVLAEAARARNAAFIHFSSDYVFDGSRTDPYRESDPVRPLSEYGRSKLAGERAVQEAGKAYLILRTSWVYSLRRESFVTKVLAWARRNESLRIVADQTGSPTWCRALAECVAQVLAKAGEAPAAWLEARAGLYHLAGAGAATRLEWARAVLEFDPHPDEQIVGAVLPAVRADFPTPAARPANAALDNRRFAETFGLNLPLWREALRLAMEAP